MERNWKQTIRELWKKEKWYWISAVAIGVVFTLLFATIKTSQKSIISFKSLFSIKICRAFDKLSFMLKNVHG